MPTNSAVSSSALDRDAAGWRAGARRAWREHQVVVGALACYVLGSLFLAPILGWQTAPPFATAAGVVLVLSLGAAPVVLLVWWFAELWRQAGGLTEQADGRHAWRVVRRRVTAPDRLLGIVIVLAALWLLMATLTAWRANIPSVRPFAHDVALVAWSRRWHGGRLAWEWLQPVLGHPPVTRVLAWLYGLGWGGAKVAVLFACAVADPSHLRRRILLAYVLEYAVLGSLLATLVSSAGPVYYGAVTGAADDPFASQLDYLRSLDADGGFAVVRLQDRLWSDYESGVGFGITAFPSLHVASGAMLGLIGQQFGRVGAGVGWALCALVLVGSVHLGWHYAVDGYVSIAVMAGLWWVAGRLTAL